MIAGFSRVEITPLPREHPEMMGFGAFLGRTALEVLQPIHVRASYLEDGGKALVLSFDLCGLSESLAEAIRKAAGEAAGLSAEQVVATCTHTHSAPSVMPIIGWGEFDEATAGRLPRLAAQAAEAARGAAAAAAVESGRTTFEWLSRNRVYGSKGSRDTELRTFAFREMASGRLLGLWAHYTCHPVLLCEQCRVISPDFCGVAMQALEAASQGAVCSFLQGYCGDINPLWAHMKQERSIVNLAHAGRRFRVAVGEAMAASQPATDGSIRVASKALPLSVALMSEEAIRAFEANAVTRGEGWRRLSGTAGPAIRSEGEKLRAMKAPRRNVPTAALAVGQHTLVFHPFEMFTQVGLDIRERLGADTTWVVGYANGYEGYAPTIDRFAPTTGDYAAHGVPLMMGRNPYSPALSSELIEGLTKIGEHVKG